MTETLEPSAGMSATEATLVDTAEGEHRRDAEGRYLEAGMEVGPYRLLEPVGMGGVGVVYAAYDPRLDRRVALKLLRGARRRTPEARQRLEREAQAMAQLNHPNVITVHDVGEFEGEVYLTMEFADGGTLKEWIRGLANPRTPEQIERVLERYIKAGRGLAAAHAAELVHRDFKPDNVLLSRSGQVLVTDFGLVRGREDGHITASHASMSVALADVESSSESISLTRTGSVLGTPAYMSPEQHAGLVADASSDQFSFCVSLYEGLYGQRPFEGKSAAALALAVTEGKVQDPPRGHKVPESVRKVLWRGLSTNSGDRWPSMDALLDELMRTGLRRGFRAPVWIAGGIAAVLGAGIISNVMRPPAPCTGEDQAWALAWNAQSKAAAEQAFEATGLPYAKPSFARVNASLQGYGREWKKRYRDNCEATRVHATQSERLMDLRSICLERRRDQVLTLASLLAEVDAKGLSGVDSLLSNLGAVADCDDKSALLSREHQFELDTPSARELRDALSRAELLRLGGSYDRAESELTSAQQRARQSREKVLVAETEIQLGRLADARGQLEEARTHLEAAVVASLEARALGTAGIAWSDLVGIVGFELGKPEPAERYAQQALAALAGSDGEHPAAIGRVHNGLGMIAYGSGRYDEAEAEFKRVLAINERRFGPDHPRTADVLNNLGAIAFARNDLDASEAYHRRCLAIWSEAYGGEHPDIGASHNNLGTLYEARGEVDRALEAFNEALRIRLATLGPEHGAVAMSYYNIAIAYEGVGKHEEAREQLERAVPIFAKAHGAEHGRVASARTALGRVLVALGRPAEGRIELEAALKIRQAREGDPSDLAETKYGLATALIAEDREGALALGREAAELYGDDWPDEANEVRSWLEAQSK